MQMRHSMEMCIAHMNEHLLRHEIFAYTEAALLLGFLQLNLMSFYPKHCQVCI